MPLIALSSLLFINALSHHIDSKSQLAIHNLHCASKTQDEMEFWLIMSVKFL